MPFTERMKPCVDACTRVTALACFSPRAVHKHLRWRRLCRDPSACSAFTVLCLILPRPWCLFVAFDPSPLCRPRCLLLSPRPRQISRRRRLSSRRSSMRSSRRSTPRWRRRTRPANEASCEPPPATRSNLQPAINQHYRTRSQKDQRRIGQPASKSLAEDVFSSSQRSVCIYL